MSEPSDPTALPLVSFCFALFLKTWVLPLRTQARIQESITGRNRMPSAPIILLRWVWARPAASRLLIKEIKITLSWPGAATLGAEMTE